MNKLFCRIISLALVPCLLADPVMAAGIVNSFTPLSANHLTFNNSSIRFQEEALASVATWMEQSRLAHLPSIFSTYRQGGKLLTTSRHGVIQNGSIIRWMTVLNVAVLITYAGLLQTGLILPSREDLVLFAALIAAESVYHAEWMDSDRLWNNPPDWARLNAIAEIMLFSQGEGRREIRPHQLLVEAREKFVRLGLEIDTPDILIPPLFQRLENLGVLHRNKDSKGVYYQLKMSDEEVAIKMDSTDYIRQEFQRVLGIYKTNPAVGNVKLKELLFRYSEATQRWPLHRMSVERPVLRALQQINLKQRQLLEAFLDSEFRNDDQTLIEHRLINSIILLFKKQAPDSNKEGRSWVDRFTPHLKNRAILLISPEVWYAVGGLGRVMQFLTWAMRDLSGPNQPMQTIEPYYNSMPDGTSLQYSSNQILSYPIHGLGTEPLMKFDVDVDGSVDPDGKPTPVEAWVFRGYVERNGKKIDAYLIRDKNWHYTKVAYAYYDANKPATHGRPTWEQFSEFFSRASLELSRRLEDERKRGAVTKALHEGLSEVPYQPAVLHTNDGQLGMFSLFKRILDKDEPQNALRDAVLWYTTHTIPNRGGMGMHEAIRKLKALLTRHLHRWTEGVQGSADQLFEHYRQFFWRINFGDWTSMGIRPADGSNTVGPIQHKIVESIDPHALLISIDNGDDLQESGKYFKAMFEQLRLGRVSLKDPGIDRGTAISPDDIMRAFQGANEEFPTDRQVFHVKREGKSNFELPKELLANLNISLAPGETVLNSNQPVISYAGRQVTEKDGIFRAFFQRWINKWIFGRSREDGQGLVYEGADRLGLDLANVALPSLEGNIRNAVAAGAQVVIYGNVQASEQSRRIHDALVMLAKELNKRAAGEPGWGKLIVRTGWNLEDQRKLLAVTDVLVLDSDHSTEAAGFTEVNGARNGAFIIGPAWPEGLIQLQGVIRDKYRRGKGNFAIPKNDTPEAYWEVMKWAIDEFKGDLLRYKLGQKLDFAAYQATSVHLSWTLSSLRTATAYFQAYDDAVERKENPLISLRESILGVPRALNNFSTPWARDRLVTALRKSPEAIELKSSKDNLKAFAVRIGEELFLTLVDVDGPTDVSIISGPDGRLDGFTTIFGITQSFQIQDAVTHADYGIRLSGSMSRDDGLSVQIPHGGIGVQVLRFLPIPEAQAGATSVLSVFSAGIGVALVALMAGLYVNTSHAAINSSTFSIMLSMDTLVTFLNEMMPAIFIGIALLAVRLIIRWLQQTLRDKNSTIGVRKDLWSAA